MNSGSLPLNVYLRRQKTKLDNGSSKVLLSAKADNCFIEDPDFNPGQELRHIS